MKNFKKIWNYILHFYLGELRPGNRKTWRKNSELVATTFSTNSFLWAYALLAYFTIDIPYLAPACFLLASINLLSPILCRYNTPSIASNIGMLAGTIQLTMIVYFTGGYQSESIGMYGIMPLISGIQTGKSGLKTWVPVALIIIAALWGLQFNDIALTNFQNDDGQAISRLLFIVAWLILCTAIILAHLAVLEAKESQPGQQNIKIKNLLRVLLHDITTPMAIISGAAKLRLKTANIADHKKEFLKIAKYSRIIEEIIKSAKELYLASHDNKEIELEPIEISDSIYRVLTLLDKGIKAKSLNLKIGTLSTAPIEGLKSVFEFQILQNVLTNAIKFTPKMGEIEIFTYEEKSTVGIIIQDSGIGITEMEINKLFSDNFPPSKKGTEGEFGTGFGLLIMKHYLDIFKAGLKISSQATGDNTGTKVELIFNKFVRQK